MQVAKNEFLAGLDRDFRYKLLQIHYAMMLENEFTKDQILERYLNTVFFGNNAYGVQAASEVYFGTTVDEITMVQAIFLASLVRSPSGYDPIDNPERSRARFQQVIDGLVEDGTLTAAEAQEAAAVRGAGPSAGIGDGAGAAAHVLHRGAHRVPVAPVERALLRRLPACRLQL